MAVTRSDTARRLRELIDALDRRAPRLEHAGEASIAREAAALREKAVNRLAEIADRPCRPTHAIPDYPHPDRATS